MLQLPDRLGDLIKRLEAGHAVTRDDLDRVAKLRAFDIAKLGEDFARDTIASNEAAIAALEEGMA